MAGKSDHAFSTIGELAAELDVPQHILRYWETRFPQLKPLQRAGNRRYYRPHDVALARRIHRLLNEQGYTIRGVQRLLETGEADASPQLASPPQPPAAPAPPTTAPREQLLAIRALLAQALADAPD